MNKTLYALTIQLTSQINTLYQEMLAIEQQIQAIETEIVESQQYILDASVIPEKILPEQEMARLYYTLGQQQHLDELNQLKTNLLSEQSRLQSGHLRKSTELKRLEKYQNDHLNMLQQKALVTQQNNMDEWILLHQTNKGAF